MCATLTKTSPFDLVKRVLPPLLIAVVVEVLASILMVAGQ